MGDDLVIEEAEIHVAPSCLGREPQPIDQSAVGPDPQLGSTIVDAEVLILEA